MHIRLSIVIGIITFSDYNYNKLLLYAHHNNMHSFICTCVCTCILAQSIPLQSNSLAIHFGARKSQVENLPPFFMPERNSVAKKFDMVMVI